MSVYVDPLFATQPYHTSENHRWNWKQSCHLVADTEEELHAFAARLGLKRAWFQPKSRPHYDLNASKREQAVHLGARQITHEQLAERPFKQANEATKPKEDRRARMLEKILERIHNNVPVTLTYEQENILMYGSPEVPGWATDLARNEGIPTKTQPDKCSACKVPMWRWSAKLKDWVCLGCKIHDIVHLRKDGDVSTLEGCFASGIYKSNHTNGGN